MSKSCCNQCSSQPSKPCSKCGRYQISWNDVRFKPNWVNSDNVPQTVKVSVTSAEVLALEGSPVLLLSSFGSGHIIDVISVKVKRNFGTAAYVSANPLLVGYENATNALLEADQSFLEGSADGIVQMGSSSLTFDDNVVENAGLYAYVENADPTTGDGTFDFYITYRTITL
jgi:hypothetical protein